ncbi:MAG: hypothetical protein KGJ90_01945 [Patescibacteria group bacterium]|nr:hypothetical protein [Patescibacteria group bacterium]
MRKLFPVLMALLTVLVLIVGTVLLAATPVTTITGTLITANGSPAANTRVYFHVTKAQSIGGSVIAPLSFSVVTDSLGNLPSGVTIPQGAIVNISVGTGQPTQVTVPLQSTVDLSTLITVFQPPSSIVSQVNSGSSTCTTTNPAPGVIGPATISCSTTGSFPLTQNVSANGKRITNLATDTITGDALSRNQSTLNSLAVPTTSVPMNLQKFTGLTTGSASGDSIAFGLNHLNDLAAATGNYAMGSNKITGLGAPSTTGDALSEGHTIGATAPATGTFTTVNGTLNGPTYAGADIGAQLDAAIASAGAAGGKITIPPGIYSHTTTIQCPTANRDQGKITIEGAGGNRIGDSSASGATVLKYTGSGDAFNQVVTSSSSQDTTGCVLRNLVLDGSGASGSATGVHFGGVNNFQISNVTIESFPGPGVLVENASGLFTERYMVNGLSLWHNNPSGPQWEWLCDSGCQGSFGHFSLVNINLNLSSTAGTNTGFKTVSLGSQKAFVYGGIIDANGNIEGSGSGDTIFATGTSGDSITGVTVFQRVECNETSCHFKSIASGSTFAPALFWLDSGSAWSDNPSQGANGLLLGQINATDQGGLFLGNNSTHTGSVHETQIESTANTVQGITGTLLGVADDQSTWDITLDQLGNLGVAGTVHDITSVPLITAIASLPTCNSSVEGAHNVVNNCNAGCSAGGTCTAGGSTHCEVYCNGTAYVETGR